MSEQTLPQREEHNYLLGFTIAAIIAGFIVIIGILDGIQGIINDFEYGYGWAWSGLLWSIAGLVISGLVIAGGWHTLKVTKGFTQWDKGVSEKDKLIGWGVIIVGFFVSLFFLILIFTFIAALKGERRDR